jgi:hypothetical protein
MSMYHGKLDDGKIFTMADNDYIMHYDDDDWGGNRSPVCCPVCQSVVQRKNLLEHAMAQDDVGHAVYVVHQS